MSTPLSSPTDISLDADGLLHSTSPDAASPTSPRVAALGALEQFKEMVTNPVFKSLDSDLIDASETVLKVIMKMPIQTIGDLLQREQLFGEWRGLKRMGAWLIDTERELKEAELREELRKQNQPSDK